MSNRILIFYGSYRSDRMGIRLAEFVVERFRRRGDDVELIDAKAANLPMLDRMYKEYPPGKAPDHLERLASKIREADGFVFITGEYNWGMQPGLKNLTDHLRGRLILESKRLLAHSDLNVSEIAYQLGFEDPSYFTRLFRQVEGLSPREFREEYR